MKKICSIALILSVAISLFGCSKAVIYEEETKINAWLKERTEGYVQITPSSQMNLTNKNGTKIDLETGSDMIPELKIKTENTAKTVTESSILTVTSQSKLFAQANHKNSVFDPYKNHYTRALQVWKKDDSTFRIFFWLYGEYTDFYPIPKLLTQAQYNDVLELVKAYDAEQGEKNTESGTEIIDYVGDFINLYKASYVSDKATNPDGDVYYECVGETKYAAEYRILFAKLGLSEQDWRKSFESLGYTGQQLNLQIVYCDLTLQNDTVTLTLQAADAFTSALLKSKNLSLQYSFCPALQEIDGIQAKIK